MTQGRRGRANPAPAGLDADAPLGHSNRGARVRADGHNPFEIEHRFATPIHAGEPFPIWHPSLMPESLSAVYIHQVFSTKDRRPLLRDNPSGRLGTPFLTRRRFRQQSCRDCPQRDGPKLVPIPANARGLDRRERICPPEIRPGAGESFSRITLRLFLS